MLSNFVEKIKNQIYFQNVNLGYANKFSLILVCLFIFRNELHPFLHPGLLMHNNILTIKCFVKGKNVFHFQRRQKLFKKMFFSAGSNAPKRQLKKTHLRIHGKPPKTLHLQEGDSDFLECQAGGTPAPTIHWLKDGNLIPQVRTYP